MHYIFEFGRFHRLAVGKAKFERLETYEKTIVALDCWEGAMQLAHHSLEEHAFGVIRRKENTEIVFFLWCGNCYYAALRSAAESLDAKLYTFPVYNEKGKQVYTVRATANSERAALFLAQREERIGDYCLKHSILYHGSTCPLCKAKV